MTEIEKYYNKFNEEHRLTTRHGQVEFETSLKYIHDFIPKKISGEKIRILDLGAGTGRYSVQLCSEGYDVTAVELVKKNLEVLRSKHTSVKTWSGDARNISFLDDNSFDFTIMFGPCYHLIGDDEKLKAIQEAKRVTKKDGIIMIAYTMNEYSVLTYCMAENRLDSIIKKNGLSEDFHIQADENELYDYVRIEDINRLNSKAGLERVLIFSPDGPADYMRRELNAMSEEDFERFKKYVLAVSKRQDLIGAGSHVVDVVINRK